jgi:multisubunit Na+/H+ antiporter MnhE subunit
MAKFTWVLSILGSILGAIILFFTLTTSKGAPQEAAGAAIALAFAILPYCLARAVTEMKKV